MCRDEWSVQATGTPCRALRNGASQKLTVVPLKTKYGDVEYDGERTFNEDKLLDQVYLAPLIDPFKSAQRTLRFDAAASAVQLKKNTTCPTQVSSCAPNGVDVDVCLKDPPPCTVQYQKTLLDCARNPSNTTADCIGGVLGSTNVPDCTKQVKQSDCENHPMFCKWNGNMYVDPVSGDTLTGHCTAVNPVQTCYDAIQNNHPVCASDEALLQYVQDARSGILVERAEKVSQSSKTCTFDTGASATSYIRLRTRVPHGIKKNGTHVLIQGMGGNDGLRSVVVDDYTLTYLKKPTDKEMPTQTTKLAFTF